jgi:segregation and condensation protein B
MKHLIEACLFATGEAVKPEEFARRMALDLSLVEQEFATLWAEYGERDGGGIAIVRVAGGYQMVTRPELADEIGRFVAAGTGRSSLSRPALETLAIIAYKQPATQSEIEAVRGVNVDAVLKTLTDRNLVFVSGRRQVPGRPLLYSTTTDFLHYFGLDSLSELPALELSEHSEEDTSARHMVEMAVGIE